jgi:CheY-like chemotaxis protein
MVAELQDLRVLVVEDESMISMLIEDMLADIGCVVAGTASRLDEAMSKVSSLEFDAAILDVNLNGSQSHRIADALAAKGKPFVWSTGYGAAGLPEAARSAPMLGKPFQRRDLEKALRAAIIGNAS